LIKLGYIYPKLKNHLYWFYNFHLLYDEDDDYIYNTVSENLNIRRFLMNFNISIFRWRSRESWSVNGYYMGSGLDDYPRIDKNEVSKYHLDIHVKIFIDKRCGFYFLWKIY
jgi:hypothetical protein